MFTYSAPHVDVTYAPAFIRSHLLPTTLNTEQQEPFTKYIQFGGDKVVKVKDGTRSAMLSMVYAGAEFATKSYPGSRGSQLQLYMDISANSIVTIMSSCHNTNTHISALQEDFQWVCDVVSVGREDSATSTCTATTLRLLGKQHSTPVRGERTRTWTLKSGAQSQHSGWLRINVIWYIVGMTVAPGHLSSSSS
jgi:hypothetical protein